MSQRQRQIKFIDPSLQGQLIVALVLLESLMVIVAMTYLYQRFSELLEARMYSIHVAQQENLLQLLLIELAWTVAVMSAVNIVALLIANGLWGNNIGRIIAAFRARLQRMVRLDFSASRLPTAPEHEVLQHLDNWRALEAGKARQIRTLCEKVLNDDPTAETQLAQLLASRQEADRQP